MKTLILAALLLTPMARAEEIFRAWTVNGQTVTMKFLYLADAEEGRFLLQDDQVQNFALSELSVSGRTYIQQRVDVPPKLEISIENRLNSNDPPGRRLLRMVTRVHWQPLVTDIWALEASETLDGPWEELETVTSPEGNALQGAFTDVHIVLFINDVIGRDDRIPMRFFRLVRKE